MVVRGILLFILYTNAYDNEVHIGSHVMRKVKLTESPTKHNHSQRAPCSIENLYIFIQSLLNPLFICGDCLMLILIRQRDEATVAAAGVCKSRRARSHQLPSHSQSRALIYNLTWTEFILLRGVDQGRAGWREEREPPNLISDTGSDSAIVFDLSPSLLLFLFSADLFLFYLPHTHTH